MQTAGPKVALHFARLSVCLCIHTYLMCKIYYVKRYYNMQLYRIAAFRGL